MSDSCFNDSNDVLMTRVEPLKWIEVAHGKSREIT